MPLLQATHRRIVDLRRYTNSMSTGVAGTDPPSGTSYGCEHQFTIHTRTLLVRHEHEVTLLADAIAVRGVVNWSTGMSVNYLHVDPPPLLRLRDL